MGEKLGDEFKALGEDVLGTVTNAITSGNFSNLGNDIRGSVGRTMENIGSQVSSGAYNSTRSKTRTTYSSSKGDAHETRYSSSGGRSWPGGGSNVINGSAVELDANGNPIAGSGNTGGYTQSTPIFGKTIQQVPVLYEPMTAKQVLSMVGMVGGFTSGVVLTAVFGGLMSISSFFAPFLLLPAGLFGLGGYCASKFGQTRRFEKYVKSLGNRTYGKISDLAAQVAKKERYVRKDLQKMIANHWFRQGRIDAEGDTLITSNQTYQNYLEMKQSEADREARAAAEELSRKKAKENEDAQLASLTPEQREVITGAQGYIAEIRHCNDLIPGEEISDKLDKLEDSAERIIAQTKEEPKYVGELKRLTEYYFPTTVKLLNAYIELEKQGKTTENIQKSKAEIENAIDALNEAFDQLFEKMLHVSNVDIATDAATLQTMLKREGFLGDRMEIGSGDPK